MEVDMNRIVDTVLAAQNPGIQPVNGLRHPFVMNSEKKCRNEDGEEESVHLLFLIKSKLENFEQRNMIRRTWGRENYDARFSIRRIFLLGVHPSDRFLQHKVGMEAQDWDDIAQQYFEDAYFNNTLKLMMGLEWATTFCRGARFLAIMDDDYYVNTHNVLKMLSIFPEFEHHNTLIGYIWKNSMPRRIKGDKWYTSLDEYPFRFWPPYPTGGSVFMTMEVAQRLYIGMQYTLIIRFDDVFLGIAAWKLKLKLKHSKQLTFYNLDYGKWRYKDVVAAHGFKDTQLLYKVWKEQEEYRKERVGAEVESIMQLASAGNKNMIYNVGKISSFFTMTMVTFCRDVFPCS